MFGGRAQRARRIAQNGGKFGGGDGAHVGADFTRETALRAGTDEDNASIWIGGVQGERNGKAGMNANAVQPTTT